MATLRVSRPPLGAAVDVAGVSRAFGSRAALSDVTFQVAPGEIHALLGPNGAGKTTLLRLVAGLTTPTTGRLLVLGRDAAVSPRALRRLVGVVPAGERTFYLRISGLENLVFFARLHGLRRSEAVQLSLGLLERVGLAEAARRRVGEYSKGMQKRLAIARALLPAPAVLLVDEATHDLDPAGGQAIRSLVHELRDDGCAVVWATQRIEEIRGFADAVTVLDEGRVRFGGSVAELLDQGAGSRYLVRLGSRHGVPLDVEGLRRLVAGDASLERPVSGRAGEFLLSVEEPAGLGVALGRLLDGGVDVLSCQYERPDLEHAFLTVMEAAR